MWQDGAIPVALERRIRRERRQGMLKARKAREQVIEAAVFRVDHDHGFNVTRQDRVRFEENPSWRSRPRTNRCFRSNRRSADGCCQSAEQKAPLGVFRSLSFQSPVIVRHLLPACPSKLAAT
jgi:hypothetical protein